MTRAEQKRCGLRIAELRAKRGWTQAELSRRSGVPQNTISQIETSVQDPRVNTLRRLATALGVSLDALAGTGS